jgi:hypothetical protein
MHEKKQWIGDSGDYTRDDSRDLISRLRVHHLRQHEAGGGDEESCGFFSSFGS